MRNRFCFLCQFINDVKFVILSAPGLIESKVMVYNEVRGLGEAVKLLCLGMEIHGLPPGKAFTFLKILYK